MKKLFLVLAILLSLKIDAQTEGRKVRIKNNTKALGEIYFTHPSGKIELSRKITPGGEDEINLKENANYWIGTLANIAPQGPNLSPEKPEIKYNWCYYNLSTTQLPANQDKFIINAQGECFSTGPAGGCACPMFLERS